MKHDFVYVSKNDAKPVKEELIQIIHHVQDLVRDKFTFDFRFIGSSKQNMITYDRKSNIGFDFDVNIEINDEEQKYTSKAIKEILINAFNKVIINYGYDYCENSTRVITFKFKNKKFSKIIHSCDLAIVKNYIDNDNYKHQEYIRFNKNNNTYQWCEQPSNYYMLHKKINWLKANNYWSDLRNYYLDKKNSNTDQCKHSRSIFAESVHELCKKYKYN